ncbi:MAG: Periplasmic dipeptide transport protein precursor, partial [Candidatus Lokiarchaeum sp. GC14_75]
MEMEKKNIAIIILAVVLAASGIGNVMLAINLGLVELEPAEITTVVILKGGGPATLDPVTTWDYDSFDVQLQVLEGLVTYNLSNHPTYEIIPQLATSWGWNAAKDSIWFDLRRGVTFHDGTPFNAEAVKWNFDRVQHFINVTGDLVANGTSDLAFPSSLYYDSAGTTPIMNDTVVNSEYNVTVNLNFPFVMFLDLLTFEATTIVSPASTKHQYLDLTTDLLVGTGPYVYDSYTTDVEVRLHRYEDYWNTLPYFEEVVFSIIDDGVARNIAALAREGDIISGVMPEMLPTFNSSIYHTVFQLAEADLLYGYLEFNTQKLNSTWRDALSHAINY